MGINATNTNVISNFLHALFLFIYFIGAVVHYSKKDHTFSVLVVLFFFLGFILKILGAYAHYYDMGQSLTPAWIAISLLVTMLVYSAIEAIEMPEIHRIISIFIALSFNFLYVTNQGNFGYIALSLMTMNLTLAYYSSGMLRLGFVLIVISNILWLVCRHIENYILGYPVPLAYRYDNDIYHVLLIISTFIIYKAIAKGGWNYSRKTEWPMSRALRKPERVELT